MYSKLRFNRCLFVKAFNKWCPETWPSTLVLYAQKFLLFLSDRPTKLKYSGRIRTEFEKAIKVLSLIFCRLSLVLWLFRCRWKNVISLDVSPARRHFPWLHRNWLNKYFKIKLTHKISQTFQFLLQWTWQFVRDLCPVTFILLCFCFIFVVKAFEIVKSLKLSLFGLARLIFRIIVDREWSATVFEAHKAILSEKRN